MVCQVCGRGVGTGQRFCSACGTRVALEAPPIGTAEYSPAYAGASRPGIPLMNRVERHLQSLGVLWCVYGGLRLARGLIGVLLLHAVTVLNLGDAGWPLGGVFPHGVPGWVNGLLPWIAALTVLSTVLSFATGYALLSRKPWGRTLAIVAGALTLIKLPFGTGLGIYTLWVLASPASGLQYEAATDQ